MRVGGRGQKRRGELALVGVGRGSVHDGCAPVWEEEAIGRGGMYRGSMGGEHEWALAG